MPKQFFSLLKNLIQFKVQIGFELNQKSCVKEKKSVFTPINFCSTNVQYHGVRPNIFKFPDLSMCIRGSLSIKLGSMWIVDRPPEF